MRLVAEIARAARPQHGYVTWAQLLALGLTKHEIRGLVRRGVLIKVHRGVYAVGHIPVSPIARANAAVLACGPYAVLSHQSALTLWGVYKEWRFPYEVTAPTMHHHNAIKVHCSKILHRRDITIQLGVRVTSPAKTVLDMAPRLTDMQLSRAVNDLGISGFLSHNELAELTARSSGLAAVGRLRPLAAGATGPTRSELEDRFVAFCKRHGLPTPEMNARVNGFEVDALFREQKVIVELDGYGTHGTRAGFESDRERDAHHLDHGHRTVRVTAARMERAPVREAARLARILGAR